MPWTRPSRWCACSISVHVRSFEPSSTKVMQLAGSIVPAATSVSSSASMRAADFSSTASSL
jgi:hypothetical protein